MKKAGIHFCKFLGPGEGVNLPLEAELTGQRLSIEDALDLVKSRASEIRRSVFTAEVNF
jgi:nucleoid-associated protein YejK